MHVKDLKKITKIISNTYYSLFNRKENVKFLYDARAHRQVISISKQHFGPQLII